MRVLKEGEDFETYFEGWTVDCLVTVWASADGRQHKSCDFQTWDQRKSVAVQAMKKHIREAHREGAS